MRKLGVVVAVLVLGFAVPAHAQVGHRVESLVVPGSALGEPRHVTVHLWYPAEPTAFAAAPHTMYTSALYGKPLVPGQWDPLSWKIDSPLARDTAAIDPAGKPLPVIVFSHGAVNDPIDYAYTLEQIAYAGFIVAAPYHVNNTQDDVRIDTINALAGTQLLGCDDGRPGPCSRPDNARSVQDRVRDVSAIIDALPAWFGARADTARIGVMGHSRGTITALATAGGSTAWAFGPEPRVKAIMGMAIGARMLRDAIDLPKISVPTLLVAGSLDRNTVQAISEEAYATIGSADKRLVILPDAEHRSFDSTYCAQLHDAAVVAMANPRAVLDQYSVPLIAASAPGGVSGKASNYCSAATFTGIESLIAATPNAEFPPTIGGSSVCTSTAIPCTGLDTDAVKDQMTTLAVDFFTTKLARAAGGVVGGTVPATLALTLGPAASFGAFTPGVTKDYSASTTADVVSSAGDATLTAGDPGHLMNGPFALPSPLTVSFSTSSWTAPVSHDAVTIAFHQHIDANHALRTGSYIRTLTFTLSTATP